MDHPKRVLILMTVCWALTVVLPSEVTLDSAPSITTTVELAAGDQSVGKTIGLAARALFQAAPAAAQNGNGNGNGNGEGWTCGWCTQFKMDVVGGGSQWFHGFYDEGGDRCLSDGKPDVSGYPPELEASLHCSQCQPGAPLGEAPCHTTWGESAGQCHEPCGGTGPNGNGNGAGNGNGPHGGGGSFVALRGAIGDALARGDAAMIGDLAQSDGGALYTLAYAPEGGRLELFVDCDPVRPVAAFPVPMGVREALAATLAGP